jgi:hypothetical protein
MISRVAFRALPGWQEAWHAVTRQAPRPARGAFPVYAIPRPAGIPRPVVIRADPRPAGIPRQPARFIPAGITTFIPPNRAIGNAMPSATLSVEIMPNNLIFCQCRASGLRCCVRYDRVAWGTIRLGGWRHGDFRPDPVEVCAALRSRYTTLAILESFAESGK